MQSHITDSAFLGPMFAPPAIASVFDDMQRIQRWLDVEAALAAAQAELGMIPEAAAREIAAKAKVELLDAAAIAERVQHTGHLLVPTIRALEALCEDGAGEWLHYGATTQDIIDTGLMLQLKEGWGVIRAALEDIRASLAGHARTHRATPMAGRTHGQQALPVTWGYKLAVWVDEIDRHLARADEMAPRVFVGNITGAVGTMASFGAKGPEMQDLTLRKLGLSSPRICWHSSRDRMAELAFAAVQVAATCGKIANEVYNLQRVEIGEVREPFHHGKVGSSTMPHKQNPSTCELILALARLARGCLVPMTDALFQEHERDVSAWRMEWAAMPEAMVYTGAVVLHMKGVAAGLEARPAAMARNLDMLGGLMLAERVMLSLAPAIGKQTAHEVVYDCAMRAQEQGTTFRNALKADDRVTPHLSDARIEELLDPAAYIGLAPEIVDEVVG